MKKAFTLTTLLTVFLMAACHFNSQYINREEDKVDAEKVSMRFYEYIKNKEYEQTAALFSDSMLKTTPKEKIYNLYTMIGRKLGDFKGAELVKWETRRVEGSNPSGDYTLLYKTKYGEFEAMEDIRLIREVDGSIKIVGYHVTSDEFIK